MLRRTAQALVAGARATDQVIRMRARVAQLGLDDVAPGLRATISVGVARHQPPESIAEWLKRADLAMYRAKASGRNIVAVCQQAPARNTLG